MKNIIIVKNKKDCETAINYLSTQNKLGVDSETTGFKAIQEKMLLLQIGNTYRQYVFDLARIQDCYGMIRGLLADHTIIKIFHNAKFDYTFIKSTFGIDVHNVRCTLVAAQLLTRGIIQADNSLKGLLSKHLNVNISKSQQKSFIGAKFGEEFTDEQLEYAGTDIEHLVNLENSLLKLLNERGMHDLYRLECETTRVTGDMEYNGLFLDTEMWLGLANKSEKETRVAIAALDEYFLPYCNMTLFGEADINYGSPQQLLPILNKITGQNIESTGEEELKKINHPVIKPLLAFREHMKKVTTYGKEFVDKHINSITGRIHSSFKQLGADSGRMASGSPNLQNIPAGPEYRECFRAQHVDYRLICADFSGQELRLLAHISKEPQFIYALSNNMDLHSYSASLIFGIPYDDFFERDEKGDVLLDSAGDPVIKKEMKKKYRNPAKSITFG